MEHLRDQARRLFDRWAAVTLAAVPEHAELFDAHTHLGHDIGGIRGELAPMIASMDRYGVRRANVFCLDEPDREPAFRAGNDRTLAFAEQEPERLVPFVRLDLAEGPVDEATRCLDRGARGIKLHPRAQRFTVGDARLEPIFALAAERRVPILIHGGLGMPPIADELSRLVERYDEAQLIVAHAGIADMTGLVGRMAGRPGVFFDTSTWSTVDLLALYGQVPPEQVMYASDAPYGQQPSFLLLAIRTALAAGLDEERLTGVLGGNAARVADGEPPQAPSAVAGPDRFALPFATARVHQYVTMAMPLLWSAMPDRVGLLTLAINACHDDALDLADVAELLGTARAMWERLGDQPERERRGWARSIFRLVHLADIVAVTTP